MANIAKTLVGTQTLAGSATDTYVFTASPLTANVANSKVKIICTTTSAALDIDLPEISTFSGLADALEVIIVDGSSNAATNNIVINAGGTDKINDAASATIAVDGGSLVLKVGTDGIWVATNAAIAP